MTETWSIAIAGFVVTITLGLFGLGIKALWSIANTFRELVTKNECASEMGKHCKDIETLRNGFEENKTAIRQILSVLKRLHGESIEYKG